MRARSTYPLVVLACSLLLAACAHAEPDHKNYTKGRIDRAVLVENIEEYGTSSESWEKVAKGTGASKEDCQKQFMKLSKEAERKAKCLKKNILGTGGGPPPKSDDDPLLNKVKALVGPSIEGLHTIYDGDRDIMALQHILPIEMNENKYEIAEQPSQDDSCQSVVTPKTHISHISQDEKSSYFINDRANLKRKPHILLSLCQSMDIRNSPKQFNRLKGCRVIEGQLSIVLMENATPKIFENMSFPELTEVTGYVLIYRAMGVINLGDLFPNLTVVRGMQLFKDFAIVIFDNQDLEALGLRSLMVIERGGVRIERNDRLCYVNTIDWKRISSDAAENKIRTNYDIRFCGLCPNAQSRTDEDHRQSSCPTESTKNSRLLCWDGNHCQKTCPVSCGTRGCLPNNTCCHPSCLGGCDGVTARDCRACRNFSFGDDNDRVCIDRCPNGTYELFRRCVTEQQCRQQPLPPPPTGSSEASSSASIRAYKIHNKSQCVYICPSGFMEVGTIEDATCAPCPKIGGCRRECIGNKIDSVAAAEQYRGCTHINGKLEIYLRAGGGNTLATLESCLGEIREINGSLQVSHSYPLVSLMFLKSLRRITGTKGSKDFKGLYILNNQNLELLWEWDKHGAIDINGGSIYIHENPKLCYNQLTPLRNMTNNPRTELTQLEVSDQTNGYLASCLPGHIQLSVQKLEQNAAVLTWDMYCQGDMRKLLGYSVYYISTNKNVTLYEQRDACSDSWNVIDKPIDETQLNRTQASEKEQGMLDPFAICAGFQPLFQLLTSLVPYTRYAAYVKTFTTLQDKKGAQSPIIYFTTLPAKPSPPQRLTVELLDAHTVGITWSPPLMPNGTIIQYLVEVQANSYNQEQILAGRRDSSERCSNPNALANLIAQRLEVSTKTQETTEDANNGTCACDADKPKPRFSVAAEEERVDSIHFENELQNWVYKKSKEKVKSKNSTRHKRSLDQDNTLNRMLVKLTENIKPKPGLVYENSTDAELYVKSLYYKLEGNARSVIVKQLRHFTWYTVNVWACRQKDERETLSAWETRWCSDRSYYTFLTLDLANADVVENVHAVVAPTNKTNDVNVNWKPPQNPNGFVVAYNVHYSRVDEDTSVQEVGLQSCLPASDYETNGRGVTLRNLSPGNYSIKITPITVKGQGNASSDVFFFIPERTAEYGYEWVWGVASGCLVMILILVGVFWYVKRGFMPNAEAHKLFASVNPEYVSTVYVPDEWEVPRANIEFVRELGQGSFGMVYEGLAKNLEKGKPETRCAVKTVNEHATDRERVEFLNEASVMKAFDTFHVVRLMGVVSRGQPTLVVMELMELGDLKTYLRSHRPDSEGSLPKKDGDNTPPTLQNILQMAIEIADGMAYLSAKKFVHRDLAARNCMVAGDLTVKVGDFGMTRDIYETDYYRKGTKGLLPVRWMSPESLKDGVFSSNSDAWSYGVVLWEMATLAMQPYQGLSNEQVVRYVVEGGVMERPEHCPDRLYELMRACWAHRPASRPSFLHLVAELTPSSAPYFRHRSFFHTPQGQEMYALQRSALEEEPEVPVVGAVATGSGSNLFGVSGRLASWVRELSSVRSRTSDDAAAEPLQPLQTAPSLLKGPNGILRDTAPP